MIKKILLIVACLNAFGIAYGKGTLTYRQFQRLNDPHNERVGDSWFNFSYEKEKAHSGNFESFVEFHGRYFSGTNQGAFSVPEAYLEYNRNKTTMTYGRKIVDWNPAEYIWGIGELNGMRGFSLLEEDREGLIGIHLERKSKKLRVSAFASYLYIPQLNPNYKIVDGEVTSASEWSKLPPKKVFYNEADVPVYYTLEMPKISDIALQPSYGARASYEWSNGGVTAFGIYKPEPTARINATGYYQQTDVEQANVRAKPFANHHRIFGGNIQQQAGNARLTVSYFKIIPERGTDPTFEFEPLRIEPTYSDEAYVTAQADFKVGYVDASVGLLELVEYQEKEGSIFGKTPKWRRAAVLRGSYEMNDYLAFMGDFKYDTIMKDKVFQGAVALNMLKRKAKIVLGFEILEAPDDSSFWAPFRSNDSLYSNFSYIF